MKFKNYILYGACLFVIAASYYLGKTKEMVCQTFIDRIENKGKVAHVIKQEDCFRPFGNVRFRAPTHYIGQVYDGRGKVESRLETLFPSRTRRFVRESLK